MEENVDWEDGEFERISEPLDEEDKLVLLERLFLERSRR